MWFSLDVLPPFSQRRTASAGLSAQVQDTSIPIGTPRLSPCRCFLSSARNCRCLPDFERCPRCPIFQPIRQTGGEQQGGWVRVGACFFGSTGRNSATEIATRLIVPQYNPNITEQWPHQRGILQHCGQS